MDVDVTAQKPYLLLDRESIIYDMRTRAAVSDFSPAKQYVLVRPISWGSACQTRPWRRDTEHKWGVVGSPRPP